MVAQLGQGGSHLSRMESDSSEALISPSTHIPNLVQQRRRSTVSVESMDSDDEMGLNEPYRPPLATFASEQTLAAVTNFNTVENEDVRRERSSSQSRKDECLSDSSSVLGETPTESSLDDSFQKSAPIHPELQRLRSEGSTKVSRSSSAPSQDRPKVESVSLSRSSSEPKEPKRLLRKTSKGEIITEGLPLAKDQRPRDSGSIDYRASLASSSFSESEISSTPSLHNSLELSGTSSTLDDNTFDAVGSPTLLSDSCASGASYNINSPISDVSSSFDARPDDVDELSGRPVTRSASAPAPLKEIRPHSVSECQDADQGSGTEDEKSATFPRRRAKASPGLKALQSLSETLEISLKQQPTKQAPQIKSPLIAQQKLQSAINSGQSSEAPKKKTSLPKRSSPIMTRRPDNLMRSKSYAGLDNASLGSPDEVKNFLTLSSEFEGEPTESKDYDGDNDNDNNNGDSSPTRKTFAIRRSNTDSRAPLKPDKEHYKELEFKSTEKVEKPKEQSSRGSTTPRLRKKSMSLSDLLSIGRDLTSGRSKNSEGNNTPALTRKESRHKSDSTDDRGEGAQRKHSLFRLGRTKSRSDRDREMKDGIASGPNIDKRKATKLFLTESLMLESS